jgi:putative aldouronate transport system substrate-binding protein
MILFTIEKKYTLDMIKEKGPGKLSEEKITLRFFAGDFPTDIREKVDDILQTKWLEQSTNVHIDWIMPAGGEEATALTLLLASGDYPDVIYGKDLSTAQILSYAEQGILIPLNDYLEDYAPEYYKIIQENKNLAQAVTAPGGKIYAFPRTDGGLHVKTYFKMYTYTPWLEEYKTATGKGTPSTTVDFENMLKFYRDNDMNKNGKKDDEIPLLGYAGDNMVAYLIAPYQVKPRNNLLSSVFDFVLKFEKH